MMVNINADTGRLNFYLKNNHVNINIEEPLAFSLSIKTLNHLKVNVSAI
jgi:hypothetical protein